MPSLISSITLAFSSKVPEKENKRGRCIEQNGRRKKEEQNRHRYKKALAGAKNTRISNNNNTYPSAISQTPLVQNPLPMCPQICVEVC